MQHKITNPSPVTEGSQEVLDNLKALLQDLRTEYKNLLAEIKAQGPTTYENPRASFYYEERARFEYMIRETENAIASFKVVERKHSSDGKIDFGDIVICREVETNSIAKFQLSEQMEIPDGTSDVRKVTKQAPIGKALEGKKTGDVVSVVIPQSRWGGTLTRTLEILDVIQENTQEKQPGQE